MVHKLVYQKYTPIDMVNPDWINDWVGGGKTKRADNFDQMIDVCILKNNKPVNVLVDMYGRPASY